MLFDLGSDPTESVNLYYNKDYSDVSDDMGVNI